MTPTLKENGRADGMMLSCRGKAANLGGGARLEGKALSKRIILKT